MLKIRIVKKEKGASPLFKLFIVLSSFLLAVLLGACLLKLQNKEPWHGIVLFFQGGFGSKFALEDMIIKAIPIYFCSIGVALAFKLRIWNIGAEGQYALGAIGASLVALSGLSLGKAMLVSMGLVAGFFGGLFALLAGYLKVKYEANEIIITLMLNYIGIYFLEYLVYGPLKDPISFGFPMSPIFPDNAILGTIGDTRINTGLVLAIFIGILFFIFLKYTKIGYELKICGESSKSAIYAYIKYNNLILLSMFLSGFLAGIAGFVEVSANLNRLQPSVILGYGYTAIIVAWLAELSPFYIGVFSLLLAGFRVGVENLQLEMQVPASFSHVLQGLLLLIILIMSFFKEYKLIRQ
ncbi:ABC transporter permease [Desulfonauticus submarinus]